MLLFIIMKKSVKWLGLIGFLVHFNTIYAQDTLKLSKSECEAIFLKQNLALMAEKLEISKAEAMVIQAKLWNNPTITLDEINLWATSKQLSVFGEELKGFGNSNIAKNQQLAFSFEQLVLTAGKRKKLVALEQTNVEKSKQYFEELLRNLKLEVRLQIIEIQYYQLQKELYQKQLNSVSILTKALKNQVEQGNIPKGEYVRLRALELELLQKIYELENEIINNQKELKVLLRLPSSTYLQIQTENLFTNVVNFQLPKLPEIINQSKETRPDLKTAFYLQMYQEKLYNYEKSQRVPNITFKAGYDRGGNFMYNFFGLGISMDIPVFNRNQGNIQYAQIAVEQSKTLYQHLELKIENEIALVYRNLENTLKLFEAMEPQLAQSMEELFSNYSKNFMNRNISLLEYLDFTEAFLQNKKLLFETQKNIYQKIEELNYVVGNDIINY